MSNIRFQTVNTTLIATPKRSINKGPDVTPCKCYIVIAESRNQGFKDLISVYPKSVTTALIELLDPAIENQTIEIAVLESALRDSWGPVSVNLITPTTSGLVAVDDMCLLMYWGATKSDIEVIHTHLHEVIDIRS